MADRKDEGGGGEPLDKVLSKLDALGGRMDALETGAGSKNPLKGDKRRGDDDDDDKKKDAVAKGDKDEDEDEDKDDSKKGDEFPPKDKDDSKKADKKDDDDEGEQEEGKKAPPVAADKKKDGRKDQFPPAKAPPTSDKKGDDDDDDDKKDSKKADDDDDKRRDAAIADAAAQNRKLERQLSRQNEEIARLTALMRPRSDDEHAAFADAQARADSVFQGFGKQAPRPLEGETLINYRKRLATHLKPHSATWKSVKFSQLPEEAFGIAEAQVYSDAAIAAASPSDLDEGELREVSRTDPRTGMKTNVFYGKNSFVKAMGRPARRVASFRTQFSN